jgi:hypothetical protein
VIYVKKKRAAMIPRFATFTYEASKLRHAGQGKPVLATLSVSPVQEFRSECSVNVGPIHLFERKIV